MKNPITEYIEHKLVVYFNMSEEGGAMVKYNSERKGFDLYEIPLYGERPNFVKFSSDIEELVKEAESWT